MPNTIILLRIKHSNKVKKSIINLRNNLSYLEEKGTSLIKEVDLTDLNQILYKCEKEELDNSREKRGNYDITGYIINIII